MRAALDGIRTKKQLDAQVETVMAKKGSKLRDAPKLYQVLDEHLRKSGICLNELWQILKNLVKQLIQKNVLNTEDIVDALTLKDNETTREAYATALHVLAMDVVSAYSGVTVHFLTSSQHIPAARRLSAFRAVWRRIYLHDK